MLLSSKAKQGALAIDTIDQLDDLFNVRDYALNNVLMMVAAGWAYYAGGGAVYNDVGQKNGITILEKFRVYFFGKNNKLVLRMPQDAKQKQKLLHLWKSRQFRQYGHSRRTSTLEQVRSM